jgi:electron transfer flavoprotein beta subunit
VNIVVCLKQVPGTTKVEIDPQTNTLIRQGIENIVNPFDTYALEEGVRLKERYGGRVTAITMGPSQAETMLREALATGADEAILLSDSAFAGADTWATAYTLSRAVEKLGDCDLVICGRQTIDGDTGQVGPELAEILGVTFVAYVSRIEEIDNGSMRIRRLMGERYEVMEAVLPAVITVTKEINLPRLPSLRGKAKSRNATIPLWNAEGLGVDGSRVGLSGSATRVVKVFFPQRVQRGEVLSGDLSSQTGYVVDKLRDAGII